MIKSIIFISVEPIKKNKLLITFINYMDSKIMNQMTLEIQNFGPINKANIELGKINIIAGQNASGKTTTSKLLYCFLVSVSSEGEYLADKSIKQRLSPLLYDLGHSIEEDYIEDHYKLLDFAAELNDIESMYNKPGISVKEIYIQAMNIFKNLDLKNKESYEKSFKIIEELLDLKDDPRAVLETIMTALVNIEFGGANQIKNNFNDCEIKFYGQYNDCKFRINFINNSEFNKTDIKINSNYLKCFKVSEISYIETPYIFDFVLSLDFDLPNISTNHHQKLLMRKLRDFTSKEDIFDQAANKDIIAFQDKINGIIQGKFKFDPEMRDFKFEKNDKSFSMKNTSAGLKQLGIIQLLLENRKLPENSYLIMDEPEVHLHPEWQVKLAEIIVLLAKDLNITSYINSHSPHFIEAIEVYSAFYDLKDETNFYLTEEAENGKFNINKVLRYEIFDIYESLGGPYDKINDIRIKNSLK